MRLNLLATTAIAVLASGAAWAQAPGAQGRDEKAGAQEQHGTHAQQPAAKKEDRGGTAQAQSERRPEQAKSSSQHEEGQARGKAAQQEKNTPSSNHAQSADKPDAAARGAERKQSESRDSESPARQNAASEKSKREQNAASEKGAREKNRPGKQDAANAPGKNGESNNARAAQNKKGDANNAQSKQGAANTQDRQGDTKNAEPKQNADTAKPNEGPNKNAAGDTKSGSSTATTESTDRNAAQNQSDRNSTAGNKGSASTKISEADRTKIFSTLKSERRTTNQQLNIQVNVGERLPRQARPRRLPDTIVRMAPEYRGYEYVMVQDEIAIVRPGTREVVDVIQEPGRSYASSSQTSESHSIRLSDQQRQTLLREARPMTTSQVSGSGSSCLSYQPIPQSLANENPDLRSYQFLAIGNEIVIVDPKEQKIVDVIKQ